MAVGQRFGSYVVEASLGQGGMGVVYRGTHVHTGARVAIKTVREAELGRLSQIRSEVEALRRLNHPGLVRVLDYGVDGGRPWYAMDLVQGHTLRDILRSAYALGTDHSFATAATLATGSGTTASNGEQLSRELRLPDPDHATPPSEADATKLLSTLMGLCETLSYVHGEGIVHRDLKPSNIFVTVHDRPVLVDFGLAANGTDASGREVLDTETLRGGSVHYMAPEQIRGELLDPRCDLYALGCVLFEVLTGRTPFVGRPRDVIEQHQRQAPPSLSRFRPGVPPRLERLVARLLAKDRADRIGYARDVAGILSECGAQAPGWDCAAPPERTYLYRPPLVGRDDALGQLDRALRRLWREHGDVVLVEGESGVGKTRFAMEVAHRAARNGIRVIAGCCASMSADASRPAGPRGAPLNAFRPLLVAVADACTERGPEEAGRLLGTFGSMLAEFEPGLREVCGPASSLPPLPASAARARLYQALEHVLEAFSQGNPLLLVLDDLQWADELSLGFLQHWAERSDHPSAVLFLATSRREERTEEHTKLTTSPGVRHIALPRLRADDVGQMVAGMLSLSDAPEAFIRFLSRTSEGNPFFVAEYLRTAVHERVLVREVGKWRVAASSEPTEVLCDSLPLPQSLRAIVEHRLRGLPGPAVELVRLAAVAGREFDLDLLQHAGCLLEADLVDALTELTTRQVIEPAEDGKGFRFAHDKLREIPYSELSTAERRRLHGQIATAMEVRQAAGRREPPAVVGLHWSGAEEPARAVPYLQAAGDDALRVHALDQALDLFRAALSALDRLEPRRTEEIAWLYEQVGDVSTQKGAMVEAREAYEQAIASREPREHVNRARLRRKLGKTWEAAHDHREELAAYDLAERELELAAEDADGFRCEWIQVKLNRTWVFYWQARIDDMNQILSQIEPHLEQHASPRQRSNFYQALVTRDYRRDRFVVGQATIQNARRSVMEAQAAKDPVETALARFVLGFGLLFSGEVAEAQGELEGALKDTRRLGNTTNEIRCLAYLLLAARRLQAIDDTRTRSAEVLSRATSARMLDYVGLSQACLGWVHYKEGNRQDAVAMSRRALEAWGSLSFCYPFQWTALLTLLACELDESSEKCAHTARQLMTQGMARLPKAIDSALNEAVDAYERCEAQRGLAEARRAVQAAVSLGLL